MSHSSPITAYLCSSPITVIHSPNYDHMARQLPYQESLSQQRERRAFVQSLRWQRRVKSWMQHQQHSSSTSPAPRPAQLPPSLTSSPRTMSSRSCSPRTPSPPLNTPHTHTHKPQSLDNHLPKSFDKLATPSSAHPVLNITATPNSIKRNYKNLNLQLPPSSARPFPSSKAQSQPQATVPARGIFDSGPSPYPYSYPLESAPHEAEPYLFYSSSSSSSSSNTTRKPVDSIGQFPTPKNYA